MSWWSDIQSTLGPLAKSLTGGGSYLSEEERKKQDEFTAKVKGYLSDVDKQISKVPLVDKAQAATKTTADLLLKGAVMLNDKVISPYITRPVSTVGLLTDPNSPLYKKGQFEEGFQFKDIISAYDRSKKVSLFQAMTKSTLVPALNPISDAILSTNGINLDEVNLWDDESIKKNFTDNAVGRWYTGVGDFISGTAVTLGAGKVVATAAKVKVAQPLGLYTKTKTVEELAADMETGILYAKTNGVQGTQTVSGSHAVLLAETKDWGVIEDLVTKYSTNERLIPIIHDTMDADVVKDLLLADKGNIAALERLAATASHKLFDIADVKSQIKNKVIQTGKVYLPEGPAVPRIKKAFDDAIASDPQFVKIRDAFFDPDYNLTIGGKAFMPKDPVIGAGALIKAQEAVRGAKTAIRNREYAGPTQFFETVLGETAGGWVMKGVRLVGRGTESLPTGFVSFSGLRPLQARTELNGFLNNLKLFRDGNRMIETSPGTFEKASVVRKRFDDEYMSTLGADSITQANALKSIDSQIGMLLAYEHKIYNTEEIAEYVATYQRNVSTGIQSARQNGFGIGHDGNVTLIDPQTVRQLQDSYRFTPWDDIERELDITRSSNAVSSLGKRSQRTAQEVFRELNQIWTFDVLARPSYAFKQSLFEPMISAGLSQGIGFVLKDLAKEGLTMAAKNTANFTATLALRIKNKPELRAVNKVVKDKAELHASAVRLKETAQASYEELLSEASPATKKQHLAAARRELKIAGEVLDEVELSLRAAMVPYGIKEAIPSVSTLERRIAFLKTQPGARAKAADIAEAKAAISNYRKAIAKLATNKKAILAADNAVEAAYNKIDDALQELGEAKMRQADVFGKSEKFKKRYYGKETSMVMLDNGEYVDIDSFIQETASGTNPFTAGYRAETQNARTAQINYMGEASVGQGTKLIKRKMPMSKIGVGDELYFEELAYIANRQYRGDALMDLIFQEKSFKEILKWAKSDAGRSYLRMMDVYDDKQIPSYLADKIALVQRMYPSYEARAAIVQGEISSAQLQKFLAPYADELYDITPSNHNYLASSFGVGAVGKVTKGFNEFTSAIFTKLASVENPIRATMFNKIATDKLVQKANYLESQGIKMTTSRFNALRQSSAREALQEMEKTLYTINNPNRFLNSLRLITAFPGANANAFMRYGRLAAQNPVRATAFVSGYGRAFETFGVDENGNPTDDINKMTHLIVPGAKEILGADKDVTLSAQSLGFLINRPSPSFVTSLSIGKAMESFPTAEDDLEEFLTVGGVNYYKVLYPYGPPTSVTDAFTPPWYKNLRNGLVGPEGQKDFLSSWKSVYNYHAMMVEMGIENEMPSDAQIRDEVKGLFRAKFFSTFASPFAGIPYKIDTNPMALTSNLYYKLIEKYKLQGMETQAARDAAGEEMITLLGPKFMLDRVTFTGSNRTFNSPATIEAYERVFEDNTSLVQKLAEIEPGQIGLVSLLTADLDYDPNTQSNNILKLLSNPDKTLPGTSKRINTLKLTPQEIETERLKQRTWNTYSAVKEALEAKITDGKTLRAHPELKNALEGFVEGYLKTQSQAWYDEYKLSASGDTSYKYARALSLIVNDPTFKYESRFQKDVETFMKARSMFAKAYQSLPDYDSRKSDVLDAYNSWIEIFSGQWDSRLQTIVKRYFDNDTLKVVE